MNSPFNKDLTGMVFGNLTALRNIGSVKKYQYDQWECCCTCGALVKTSSYNLLKGISKSCGWNHIEDLTGKKFGKLTVLERIKNKYSNSTENAWICTCDCGGKREVRTCKLTSGKIRDCGCTYTGVKYQDRSIPAKNSVLNNYKRNARIYDREFSLSKEEFYKLLSGNCFYCGAKPSKIKRDNTKCKNVSICIYNGVDRVDNNKGYTISNCVSCCTTCNSAKMDRSLEDFISWGIALGKNLKKLSKKHISRKE